MFLCSCAFACFPKSTGTGGTPKNYLSPDVRDGNDSVIKTRLDMPFERERLFFELFDIFTSTSTSLSSVNTDIEANKPALRF